MPPAAKPQDERFNDLELNAEEQAALANTEPAPEPQEEAPAAPAMPRDDGGRFVKPAEEAAEEAPAELQKPGQTVPLATLLEERRAFQARIDALAEQTTRGNERLQQLAARYAKPEEKPATVETDAIAVVRRLEQEVGELRGRSQQQEQIAQFSASVNGQVETFRSQTPDYDAAYNHLKQVRILELRAMGFQDAAIPQQLAQDEFGIAAQALQSRLNPAQVIYQLAAARGYQKPAAQSNGAGAAAPVDRLALQQRGQAAARTLSGAGGGAPPKLSLQTLADMSEAEFANLTEDQIQRIMRAT